MMRVILTGETDALLDPFHRSDQPKVTACSLSMTDSTARVDVRHVMARPKAKSRTEIAVLSDRISLSFSVDHALN